MIESFKATLKVEGAPALDLYRFEGTEGLSRLYSYSVVGLTSPKTAVKFDDLLGKPAEVLVEDEGGKRYYHGLVASARFEGTVGKHHGYRLEMVPWLWMLTRSANVRIFQRKTVPEIIKEVFDKPYKGAVVTSLSGTYTKREYCVQYRESDFNFVSRLMEDEGIYYFFRHQAGKHEMVLCDSANVHVNELGVSSLDYKANARRRTQSSEVTRWSWSRQIQTGKTTVRDHHFMTPAQNYESAHTGQAGHPHGAIEAYDYPIGLPPFADDPQAPSQTAQLPNIAKGIAKHRLEAFQSGGEAADGATNSLRLCNGARFKIAKHPVDEQNREYIVRSTSIRVRVAGYESGNEAESSHECEFTALPATVPFRAARITPKPRVSGLQTAVVVGPVGEEIFVDKYGRVKVKFRWDRDSKKDETSSCWVRVAQSSAGKQWGAVMLPRIGHEVVIDFLEGDPDQPLIVGAVYNAENMPPYLLPDNKTVSTLKSRSSRGGGVADFNELRFEDKKGDEYLLLQAQKDKHELVKNISRAEIRKDMHLTVKNDRKEKVDGEFHLTVKKAVKQKFDAKFSQAVKEDMLIDTKAKHSLKAALGMMAESGLDYSIKAGTDIHIKGGTKVTIEAGVMLTLKAGGGTIVLGPAGVTIDGKPLVSINGGGGGGGAEPVAPKAPEAPTDPEPPKDPGTV
jgi:type VI secretion system secreted protein VgrG